MAAELSSFGRGLTRRFLAGRPGVSNSFLGSLCSTAAHLNAVFVSMCRFALSLTNGSAWPGSAGKHHQSYL